MQLYLYSSLVQGAEAAIDIVNGIRYLDSLSLDVIIVGRGGGSIEDLWAFNEEIVAKAIFDCNTPIISAVGHETDTTIADYVADLRAPTPSAAAEIAVFDYNEYLLNITRYKQLLLSQMVNKISNTRNNLKYIQTKLNLYNPINQLNTIKQYSDELYTKLNDAFNSLFTNRKHMLAIYAEKLNGLSPLNKISKGFAYFANDKGEAINSVKQVNVGDDVMLTVKDEQIKAKTYDITEGVYNGK